MHAVVAKGTSHVWHHAVADFAAVASCTKNTSAHLVWSFSRRYQEKWYFTPGDTGFKVFKTKFATIGVLVCWDQVRGLFVYPLI